MSRDKGKKARPILSVVFGILLTAAVMAGLIVVIRIFNTSIIFYDNEGNRVQEVKATSCQAPNLKNEEGFTFLGWSQEPGRRTKPEIQAGETIQVWRTMRFYPVMFDWSQEDDITLEELPEPNPDKYSRVIFVGDSRCVKMRRTFQKQKMTSKLERVSFVCKSGRGLQWFQKEGIQEMMRQIHDAGLTSEKPAAVVFNLGVNDLRHTLDRSRQHEIDTPDCRKISGEYISYMNELAEALKDFNCRLFYMTINPLNSKMTEGRRTVRKEEDVRQFNQYMEDGLCEDYGYIDTCAFLAQTGYSTNNDVGKRKDDGIHYSMRTYKRIYSYAMMCINMAK